MSEELILAMILFLVMAAFVSICAWIIARQSEKAKIRSPHAPSFSGGDGGAGSADSGSFDGGGDGGSD